jgi:hypothetical protein
MVWCAPHDGTWIRNPSKNLLYDLGAIKQMATVFREVLKVNK